MRVMRGDSVYVSTSIRFGGELVVYVDAYGEDEDDQLVSGFSMTPKQARKLAKKLLKAAGI